ncbi:MAG: hypothetical protein FD166_3576 [Bacteroidetes bacterium]|nr:MAG: hypothetical protein FD166_3576 [Bacteroidota bacterium]
MSRNFCQACSMINHGVKSRIALTHTCGLEPGAIPANNVNDRLSFEKEYQHRWKKGEWVNGPEGPSKTDECTLCGCTRHWMKYNNNGRTFTEVFRYERSGISHPTTPDCWGAKNPQ